MIKTKKFIAIIAAIALIATMSVAAFAADSTANCTSTAAPVTTTPTANGIHDDEDKDVYVMLTGDITHVVCVVVEWSDFKYDYTGAMTWDAHALEYVPTEGAAAGAFVNAADNTITYTNRSDLQVVITPSYTSNTKNTVDIPNIASEQVTLAPVDTTVASDEATCDTKTITIDGTELTGVPSVTSDHEYVVIGEITIAIDSTENVDADPVVTP